MFVFTRVIFQVRVLNQAKLAARLGDRGPNRRALAAIAIVTQQPHHPRIALLSVVATFHAAVFEPTSRENPQ